MKTTFRPGPDRRRNTRGRPRGSKNRQPSEAIGTKVLNDLGESFFEIMQAAAYSRYKADRRWFAERFASLLPRENHLAVGVNVALEDASPLAQRFLLRPAGQAPAELPR